MTNRVSPRVWRKLFSSKVRLPRWCGWVNILRCSLQVSIGRPHTPATVRELLDLIRRQQGPVGGLIHLLPLRDGHGFEPVEHADAYDRSQTEVKSLFNLTKEASKDIREAAQHGGACVLATTAMGGRLAA